MFVLRSFLLAVLLAIATAACAAEEGGTKPSSQPGPATEAKPTDQTATSAAQTAQPTAASGFNLSASGGGTKFTLQAVNVAPKLVLDALAKESGWEIRVEGEPRGNLTLEFSDQPFEEALVQVARAVGYTASRLFVITPKKEGTPAAPDVMKLPLGLPRVALSLANPMPAAVVIPTLANAARVEIEAPQDLKGEAKLEADNTPLPDVLTALCQQLDMAWTIAYRLRSAPKTGPGAVPDDDEVAAREAMRETERWAQMTPQQRQMYANQQIGNLLRLDPQQRQQQIQQFTSQLLRMSRGVNRLTPEERRRFAAMIQQRAEPYMRQMQQLTPEQRREFQPAARAFQALMDRLRQPEPRRGDTTRPPAPGTPGRPGTPGTPGGRR